MFFITFAPLKNVHFVLIFGTFRFADYTDVNSILLNNFEKNIIINDAKLF